MSHHWDEFSKSLAEPLPRRESLRRLGLALTATVLVPLGSEFAWAGPRRQDPCQAFCTCRNKRQKDQCLRTCKACSQEVNRLAGSCGDYVCCGNGQVSCGDYCADLALDPYNCGACGHVCAEPGPYEQGMCIFGECEYACVDGAVDCNGACTFLEWDPDNCGACGNLCPESAPYCVWGTCSVCPADRAPCGNGCCPSGEICVDGACQPPPGGNPCAPGLALCGEQCVDVSSDRSNCGVCGNVCPVGYVCYVGSCCNPTAQCCSPDCQPLTP